MLSITVRWTIVPLGLPNTDRPRSSRPVFICGVALHLLYLDESGHSHDPSTNFFVLAGFAIFERQTHWLDSQINPVAERFNAADPASIEFHGSPMFSGKKAWEGVPPVNRVQAVVDILALLQNSRLQLRVFASVIEKSKVPRNKIVEKSFEVVAQQFDQYLANMWHGRRKDPQRGLVICDKTSYEQDLQDLSTLFKNKGHSEGKLRNFAEVPLFLDSKASRLIQMADLIAYWIFRYHQSKDDRGFKMIEPAIYHRNGQRVGLVSDVTPATEAALAAIQPHKYQFPSPTVVTVVPPPPVAIASNSTP